MPQTNLATGTLPGALGLASARPMALRFALTEKCNFRCVFCHNEGQGPAARTPADLARSEQVLLEAVGAGYGDITFTGGEPLLELPRLEHYLGKLADLPRPPKVTLVTNGLLLRKRAIAALRAYPGPKKVHVSLHAARPATHAEVVRCAGTVFGRVKANIQAAIAEGLPVTLNAVLLNRKTSRPEDLRAFLDLAEELGVARIKFIEFMVLESNEAQRGLFVDRAAVVHWLERHLGQLAAPEHLGRVRFERPGSSPSVIEVQTCTCQQGCDHCLELREPTIDPQLGYLPCFVFSRKRIALKPGQFEGAIAKGDEFIDGIARQYRGSSPTLFKRDELVAEKAEVHFEIVERGADGAAAPLRSFLAGKRARLVRCQEFGEVYYRPRAAGPSWLDWSRVLKLGMDRENDTKADLLYSDLAYLPAEVGGVRVQRVMTQFLFPDGPLSLPPERARHLLDRLDFVRFLDNTWIIDTYSVPRGRGRRLQLSIGKASARTDALTVKVGGAEADLLDLVGLLRGYEGRWRPLGEPVWRWLSAGVAPTGCQAS